MEWGWGGPTSHGRAGCLNPEVRCLLSSPHIKEQEVALG